MNKRIYSATYGDTQQILRQDSFISMPFLFLFSFGKSLLEWRVDTKKWEDERV